MNEHETTGCAQDINANISGFADCLGNASALVNKCWSSKICMILNTHGPALWNEYDSGFELGTHINVKEGAGPVELSHRRSWFPYGQSGNEDVVNVV